jgi:hypothetical protein
MYRNSQWKLTLQAPTGGRVTVFQSCLPNHGPGLLTAREDPSQRAGKEAPHLNPATDFYKRLALDCSGQQVAVDLFLMNSQYSDLATLCKFHSGKFFISLQVYVWLMVRIRKYLRAYLQKNVKVSGFHLKC